MDQSEHLDAYSRKQAGHAYSRKQAGHARNTRTARRQVQLVSWPRRTEPCRRPRPSRAVGGSDSTPAQQPRPPSAIRPVEEKQGASSTVGARRKAAERKMHSWGDRVWERFRIDFESISASNLRGEGRRADLRGLHRSRKETATVEGSRKAAERNSLSDPGGGDPATSGPP